MESLQVATQHMLLSEEALSEEALPEEALSEEALPEEAIRHTVKQYFDCFNRKAFGQAADLFGDEGQLKPPFEKAVVGSSAIAQYLQQKAQTMTAFPNQWQIQCSEDSRLEDSRLEDSRWQVDVTGQVQAITFKVNIAWHFIVSTEGKIDQAQIKLLASPHELLNLREAA